MNPDYILLLNNDTVVDKNFLNEMVNAADKDSKIGILGPKVYYYELMGIKLLLGENINLCMENSRSK